jgi:hypothetical protein
MVNKPFREQSSMIEVTLPIRKCGTLFRDNRAGYSRLRGSSPGLQAKRRGWRSR